MSEPYYTFICNPYPRDGEEIPGVPSIQNIMHIYDRDLNQAELLASFQDFMQASGYAFNANETLQVILDE
jgi:hypothetical protein